MRFEWVLFPLCLGEARGDHGDLNRSGRSASPSLYRGYFLALLRALRMRLAIVVT
jgi:hypothetical protein